MRHHLRGLVVSPELVGQAGVGQARYREPGQARQGADVVGHEGRPGGAVQPYPQQVPVGEGRVERLHVLAGQQGAHGLHGPLHRHRQLSAQLLEGPVYALQAGLDVQGVLARLQQEQVRAPFRQAQRLLVERVGQLVEGHAAGHRDGLCSGAHGAGDETRPLGGGNIVRRLPRQGCGLPVDAPGFVGQGVLGQHQGRGAEGVGLQDVAPGVQVAPVYAGDGVGPGYDQVLVAPLVLRSAEVLRPQLQGLDGRPHGAVQHQYSPLQKGLEGVDALGLVHGLLPVRRSAHYSMYDDSLQLVKGSGAPSGVRRGDSIW